MSKEYDVVIGLEIHAQLSTQSKCFSSASTDFNSGHNENVSLVCAGFPGTLPVLNQQAVDLAIKAALALNCEIQTVSVFARKQYFYPDMPKGYQLTQYEFPIARNGFVEFFLNGEPHRVPLERAHMEEDAGKSTHHGEYTLINLNRAGVPLLEIVSQPALTSAVEAAAYARAVRQALRYAEVCDGNLEEGSLRCDCNVSIKPKGQQELGTKVELKNINSFRFIEKAIDYEIQRQVQCLKSGEEIIQETRLYDSVKNKTFSMRKKEEANDYRYFPDPDLMPLILNNEDILKISRQLPEGPIARRTRFTKHYQLNDQDAELLVSERELADYFENLVNITQDPKLSCSWLTVEFLRLFNESGQKWHELKLTSQNFADLILKIKMGELSGKMAKEVFETMWVTGQTPQAVIQEKGMVQIKDVSQIEAWIDGIIKENPKMVLDYQSGKEKLFGFFVGQVMKLSGGQASPEIVNQTLKKRLKK